MSDGAIARRCGVSRPSVIDGMRQLEELGLVEKVRSPVNQIQAYRICHPMFGAAREYDSGVSEIENKPESTNKRQSAAMSPLKCAKCHRLSKWLTRAAYCRRCSSDVELVRQVREMLAENPGIAAEELAYKIKDRAELKRLTIRVRRIMRDALG
jgi:DNA-binding Lrp family transcriptional regulator